MPSAVSSAAIAPRLRSSPATHRFSIWYRAESSLAAAGGLATAMSAAGVGGIGWPAPAARWPGEQRGASGVARSPTAASRPAAGRPHSPGSPPPSRRPDRPRNSAIQARLRTVPPRTRPAGLSRARRVSDGWNIRAASSRHDRSSASARPRTSSGPPAAWPRPGPAHRPGAGAARLSSARAAGASRRQPVLAAAASAGPDDPHLGSARRRSRKSAPLPQPPRRARPVADRPAPRPPAHPTRRRLPRPGAGRRSGSVSGSVTVARAWRRRARRGRTA